MSFNQKKTGRRGNELRTGHQFSLDYLILGVEGNNHAIREELMRISGELRMLCGKII